ncbi:MAG: NB-ARC domain-containing protein, partial [Snowella sp.]
SIIEGSSNNYPVFSQYDYTWVGRASLISELLEKLNNNCRLLMLLGITGIGKTALAECLTEKLYIDCLQENSKRFLIENFDDDKKSCDFTSTAIRWLEKWGETIFENDRKDNLILPRLVHKLRDERYLVLLDSVEITLEGNEEQGWSDFKDQKWVEFFDAYLSLEDCQSKIIITSQEFPRQINAKYKNFWHDYLLKGLTPLEQLELFDKTGLEVDEDSLNRPYLVRIGKVYEGHPLALKVISGEICSEKFNGDVSIYWDEYGKEIEAVEKAIEEAKTKGIVSGKDDRDKWRLASFTKELRSRVRKRLEVTFERLRNDSFKAYYLLCAAAT